MKIRNLIIAFIFIHQLAHAQVYVPIDTANLSLRIQKAKEYTAFANEYLVTVKQNYSGGEKSYILKQFKKQSDEMKNEIEAGSYLFDSRFDKFIDALFGRLQKNNPELPSSLKFYISRNISLNASSMGNRVFIINSGAFYFLENENQMAAILSHELGHFMLKHEIKSMQNHYRVDKVEAKSKLSEVKSEKTNRSARALEKFKSLMYSDQALTRSMENEADSMGYIIYRNAGYKSFEYINFFRLSALYDSIVPIGVKESTYRKLFNFENLHFKESWLKQEDFSAYDYSKYKARLNKDSMSTHPSTEQRIRRLQQFFPELKDSIVSQKPSAQFDSLQYIAEYEQVPGLIINEDYGQAIYLCLLRLQKDSSNVYYRRFLGNLFTKVYDARLAYKLNRYLDTIVPTEQSASYQQFLSFMWNLNLRELKAIAEYYSKKGS